MKKRKELILFLILFSILSQAKKLFPQAGQLDTTFGQGGVVTTAFNISGGGKSYSTAIQSDGKIIVAGYCYQGNDEFLLLRYNTDGSLDNTFGLNGNVITKISMADDIARAVAIQSDGKIIATGYSYQGGNYDFAMVRYNVNGAPDSSFGEDGIVTTPVGNLDDRAYSVAVQDDGKILAAGYSYDGNNYKSALVRYDMDGSLDNTFGQNGIITNSIQFSDDRAYSVNIQDDGKILTAGYTYNSGEGSINFELNRYNADGTPDNTFGMNGFVTTQVGAAYNYAYSASVQDDGKIIAAGYSYNSGSGEDFAIVRYKADGTLDSTFGNNGIITTPIGNSDDIANSVVVQDNGKLIAAGYSDDDFAIVRYNINGTLDYSFGTNGILTTPVGNSTDRAYSVNVQTDGKIILAGYSNNGSEAGIAVVRYNSRGNLDNTFGLNGIVTTPVGTAYDYAESIAIQDDGKIVIAGGSYNGIVENFAAVRYSMNGKLDNAFGENGTIITSIDSSIGSAHSVAVQSDGKIVAAGDSYNGNNDVITLVRYNVNGFKDNAFGKNGIVKTHIGNSVDEANSIAIQDNDKIIVAGKSDNGSNTDFAVVRYNNNGTLDNTFGTNGIVTTPIGNSDDYAKSVAIQSDGKTIAAGSSYNGNDRDFCVVRYNLDGTLDNTFGTSGIVTTPIGDSYDEAYAVDIQANGKIVAAGNSNNGNDDDFALIRYNSNGSLDSTFGASGIVTTQVGGSNDEISSIAIQSNGKILAAGNFYSEKTFSEDIALLRYNSDGTLDTEFGDNGIITASGLRSDDYATALAVQKDGGIVIAGTNNWNNYRVFNLTRYLGDPVTGVKKKGYGEIPDALTLQQNYPNPFNPSTTIKYDIPRQAHVTLKVYNILGEEVAVLVNGERQPGSYEVKFDGGRLSSGIYLYSIKTGNKIITKKMILLK
jgi:uncharacterized delta-60 repeat protein